MITKQDILLYVQRRNSAVIKQAFGKMVHGNSLQLASSISPKLVDQMFQARLSKLAKIFNQDSTISVHDTIESLVKTSDIEAIMESYIEDQEIIATNFVNKILVSAINKISIAGNALLYSSFNIAESLTHQSNLEFDQAICLAGLYSWIQQAKD